MRIVSPALQGVETARQPSKETNAKPPAIVELPRRIVPPFLGEMSGTANDRACSNAKGSNWQGKVIFKQNYR